MSNFYSPLRTRTLSLIALSTFMTAGSIEYATAGTTPQVQACHVSVYAKDSDPKGLNVRQGPGSEHAVLALIADSDALFEVTGASGKWLRIRQAAGPDGTIYFKRGLGVRILDCRALHQGTELEY